MLPLLQIASLYFGAVTSFLYSAVLLEPSFTF